MLGLANCLVTAVSIEFSRAFVPKVDARIGGSSQNCVMAELYETG